MAKKILRNEDVKTKMFRTAIADNTKITRSVIADLLRAGSIGNLKKTSAEGLTKIGDTAKKGKSLVSVESYKRRKKQPWWKGGGSKTVDAERSFLNDEVDVSEDFSAEDVDGIIKAFGARQEQVRKSTTQGGRRNSLLSGNTRIS